MEDERGVQEVVRDLLEFMGYDVECAQDGAQTVEMYKKSFESKNPHDVVILDLTISGGVGGKEVNQQLLEINPDIRSIITSGFSSANILKEYKKHGFSAAVSKPYTLEELKRTIDSVLGLDPSKKIA